MYTRYPKGKVIREEALAGAGTIEATAETSKNKGSSTSTEEPPSTPAGSPKKEQTSKTPPKKKKRQGRPRGSANTSPNPKKPKQDQEQELISTKTQLTPAEVIQYEEDLDLQIEQNRRMIQELEGRKASMKLGQKQPVPASTFQSKQNRHPKERTPRNTKKQEQEQEAKQEEKETAEGETEEKDKNQQRIWKDVVTLNVTGDFCFGFDSENGGKRITQTQASRLSFKDMTCKACKLSIPAFNTMWIDSLDAFLEMGSIVTDLSGQQWLVLAPLVTRHEPHIIKAGLLEAQDPQGLVGLALMHISHIDKSAKIEKAGPEECAVLEKLLGEVFEASLITKLNLPMYVPPAKPKTTSPPNASKQSSGKEKSKTTTAKLDDELEPIAGTSKSMDATAIADMVQKLVDEKLQVEKAKFASQLKNFKESMRKRTKKSSNSGEPRGKNKAPATKIKYYCDNCKRVIKKAMFTCETCIEYEVCRACNILPTFYHAHALKKLPIKAVRAPKAKPRQRKQQQEAQEDDDDGDHFSLGSSRTAKQGSVSSQDSRKNLSAEQEKCRRCQQNIYRIERVTCSVCPTFVVCATCATCEGVHPLPGHKLLALAMFSSPASSKTAPIKVKQETARSSKLKSPASLPDEGEVTQSFGGYDNIIHEGYNCEKCGEENIKGIRTTCLDCLDVSWCYGCYAKSMHNPSHRSSNIKYSTKNDTRPL
eukprot:gb/GEZN01001566.1/.p1 GENE.gb/GEZN01001566.1/~~gb/GEZN01001566.1/.p1  ORF type:complete len:705 (+),score=133.74 gb/GEZN01001566.1/:334-2448(+)